MNVKVEHVEKNKVCMEVEVGKDKVNAAINAAARSLAKRVRVPGFRRGRVPRNILEMTIGKEAILDEALEALIPEAYSQAVVEQGVEPIDKPQVEVVTIEEDAPLLFKATVEVKPEIALGEYKGLALTKEKVSVAEDEVERVLQDLRERHATFTVAEEEPVADGDFVMTDYTATIDGEEFEGSKAENMPLIVGTPGYFPGLSEGLVGARKGETKEVTVSFPADFRVPELAGKEAIFNVVVKEVHKKKLAELDDEFAKDVSESDTLAELKADIEERLLKAKEEQAQTKMQEQAMKLVAEQVEVEIPEVMSKRRAHSMLHNFTHDLQRQGLTLEKYCELRSTTPEEIEQEFLPAAAKSVKQELILDAIVKKENITIGQEKITETLMELSADLKDPELAQKRWAEDGTQEVIINNLSRQEALALLVREATITEVEPEKEEEAAGDNLDEAGTAAQSQE
ncbi:MAG: trigger factor [bacterium]